MTASGPSWMGQPAAMSMLIAAVVLVGVALLLGAGLVWVRSRLPNNTNALVDAIDALLPQTQCAQCGYPGCRPYAEAVANGAALDLCPPGGKETIAALKNLLGNDVGASGRDGGANEASELVAKVREPECVGCALCLNACPVDAIVGAPGFMHSVLERQCTGCELCLPACPVDCIDLVRAPIQALTPPAAAAPKRHRALGSPTVFSPTAADAPCIGCNRCEEVCPEGLAPQHLLRLVRAGQYSRAAAAGLRACIECRLCDRACPTQIPLGGVFRLTKGELAQRAAKEANAAAAKARFQARTARLAEQEAAAEARRAKRLARLLRQPNGGGDEFRQPSQS